MAIRGMWLIPHRVFWARMLLALCAGLSAALPLGATEHEGVRREVQAGKLKPLAEILEQVSKRYPGKVVDIELERGADGKRWYEITVVSGTRREIYVDAVSGVEIRRPEAVPADVLRMDEVVARVLKHSPGVVLEGELEQPPQGAPFYKIELLEASGRERLLRVDARTGEILREPPLMAAEAARLAPLPPIIAALAQRYGAPVVEVELRRGIDPALYYEVDLQLEGGTIEVLIDAFSGKPLFD